jgi:neurofibromin 1
MTQVCPSLNSSMLTAGNANKGTENEAELLRRSCVATKMLSVYAKWKGASYLRATLQKVLERLMLTSKDLDLELDPARVSTTDELQKNALQLRIVAKVFIDDICASSSSMPSAFRKICNIVSAPCAYKQHIRLQC